MGIKPLFKKPQEMLREAKVHFWKFLYSVFMKIQKKIHM